MTTILDQILSTMKQPHRPSVAVQTTAAKKTVRSDAVFKLNSSPDGVHFKLKTREGTVFKGSRAHPLENVPYARLYRPNFTGAGFDQVKSGENVEISVHAPYGAYGKVVKTATMGLFVHSLAKDNRVITDREAEAWWDEECTHYTIDLNTFGSITEPIVVPTVKGDTIPVGPSHSPVAGMLALPPKYEVEVSFGTQKPSGDFSPGVLSVSQFNRLSRELRKQTNEVATYDDTVKIDESTKGQKKPRMIVNNRTGDIVFQTKKPGSAPINNKEYGFRIKASLETSVDPLPTYTATLIRKRKRTSYSFTSSESRFYGLRFDLTQIHETIVDEGSRVEETIATLPTSEDGEIEIDEYAMPKSPLPVLIPKGRTTIKFEVEIERVEPSLTEATLDSAIFYALGAMQGAENDEESRYIMTLDDVAGAVKQHNSLFGAEASTLKGDRYTLYSSYWNKPVNIRVDDLIDPRANYAVSVKLDGVRRFVLITKDSIYSFGPPDDIVMIGNGIPELAGTLLDTEEYYDLEGLLRVFYAFDVLFYKGKDVRQSSLKDRLELVEKAAAGTAPMLWRGTMKPKVFHTKGDFYTRVNDAFQEMKTMKFNTDGLIFQPIRLGYKNNYTRKWKPADMLTIDFLLTAIPGKSKGVFYLNVGDRGNVPFTGSQRHPIEQARIVVPNGTWRDPSSDIPVSVEGTVMECRWVQDDEGGEFVIVRERSDRDKPNAKRTADDVWNDVMSPIPEEAIRGFDLLAMRRYLNVVKNEMLNDNFKPRQSLMDWGSGRGGQLKWWNQLGLEKVYVVEPDGENLSILEERKKEMKIAVPIQIVRDTNGNLVGAESTSVLSAAVGKTQLAGITSFFSLTFLAKDKARYTGFLNSVDSLIPVGGKFVGMVMEGSRVEELGTYSNSAFSITLKEGTNEVIVNLNDPDSMVKDQTEWLFYGEEMTRALKERGFVLRKSGYVDQGPIYNTLPEPSKVFCRLNWYFVYERVKDSTVRPVVAPPPPPPPPVVAEEEDQYGGCSNFLRALSRPLSQSPEDVLLALIHDSKEAFPTLNNGTLAKKMTYPQYLEKLKTLDTIKTAEAEELALELSMRSLEHSIFVLDSNTRPRLNGYGLGMEHLLKKVYVYEWCVVLSTSDGKKYNYLMDEHNNSIFSYDSKFLCGVLSRHSAPEPPRTYSNILANIDKRALTNMITNIIVKVRSGDKESVRRNVGEIVSRVGKNDLATYKLVKDYANTLPVKTYGTEKRADERAKQVLSLLAAAGVTLPKTAKVLDVGCGDGTIVKGICTELGVGPKGCYGTDVMTCIPTHGVTYSQVVGDSYPYPANSFDLVTAFVSIHHIYNTDNIESLRKVLKPGGVLFIREHDCRTEAERMYLDAVHGINETLVEGKTPEEFVKSYYAKFMSEDELRKMFAGYTVLKIDRYPEPNPQRLYHIVLRKPL